MQLDQMFKEECQFKKRGHFWNHYRSNRSQNSIESPTTILNRQTFKSLSLLSMRNKTQLIQAFTNWIVSLISKGPFIMTAVRQATRNAQSAQSKKLPHQSMNKVSLLSSRCQGLFQKYQSEHPVQLDATINRGVLHPKICKSQIVQVLIWNLRRQISSLTLQIVHCRRLKQRDRVT